MQLDVALAQISNLQNPTEGQRDIHSSILRRGVKNENISQLANEYPQSVGRKPLPCRGLFPSGFGPDGAAV